jgi:uncharacterized membrane protein YbhN (UPF0104 family)
MSNASASAPAKPAIKPLAVIGTAAGVLLFIYTLQTVGLATITGQLRQIGLGFVVVLALSALRMIVRAKAWSLCIEEDEQFKFGQALRAFVSGDAVGNITPFGPLASEGAKALLSRRNLATSAAFSSVLLENIFYSISVALMVMIGILAFLLGYRQTNATLTLSLSLATIAIVSGLAVWWLLNSQPRLLSRFLTHDAVRDAEDRVFRFARTRRDRVGRILLLELSFHALAVAEIYFLLMMLIGRNGAPPGRLLLNAVILGTVERLITIAFKFVPLRLGVDHAGAGTVAGMIGIGSATGITIATVRTARNLFWAALGLMLLTGWKQPAASSPPAIDR